MERLCRRESEQKDDAGCGIQRSTTTEAQYDKAVAFFKKNPKPPGTLLRWVCREGDYLNLRDDRLNLQRRV